jgi:hypothetical protein
MVFDGGSLTLDPGCARAVDAHISADPPTLMLVLIGRQRLWKPILEGKLTRMLTVMSPP